MLKYKEIIELKHKLDHEEITLDTAKEIYWRNFERGKRSWHTKDWKERREEFIKESCEICNSKDTLTLQHLSHPKKYHEYENAISRSIAKTYIDSNSVIKRSELRQYISKKYDYFPIALCPKCQNRNLSKRKRKTPQYLCTECRHEFDKPINKTQDELISIFIDNADSIEARDKCFVSKKWKKRCNMNNVKYWMLRDRAIDQNAQIIQEHAFRHYLEDNIKYLSFADTITACKKCASAFDLFHMEICPNCRKFYKGIQYQTCIQCLPEEKRKVALESIEFGKEWQKMHKDLGID